MEPYFFRNPFNFYPFPGFYRPQYSYYNYTPNKNPSSSSKKYTEKNKSDGYKNYNPSDSTCHEKPIFEIFGIQLFFDDILLISLIFFLYNEGVKDQSLFIALILLLLS